MPKKRINVFFKVIFTIVFIFGLYIVNSYASNETSTIADFEYTENTNGEISITKYKGNEEIVEIPDFINNKKVTKVEKDVFYKNINIKEVVLPNGIESIENNSFFGCTNLNSIFIPITVKKIGVYAFYNCSSLTTIELPEGLNTIQGSAFYNCSSLKEIKIPSSATLLGPSLFCGCENLEKVELPDSLENISYLFFYRCTKLKNINLPSTLKTIGMGAFEYCSDLTSVIIPNNITNIYDDTFSYCVKLEYIDIPENVTQISNKAFVGCNILKISSVINSYAEEYAKNNNIEFLKKFKVTFKDYDGSVLKQEIVNDGENAIPPEVSNKTFAKFKSWSDIYTNIKENKEIIAEYYFKKYKVIFKDYNGDILSTQDIEYQQDAIAPENPSREGYRFIGWDKDYNNITSDIELIAQYEKVYTITFKDYDGSIISEQILKPGEGIIAPENPSREGYRFIGWDKDYNNITSDIELIAQYEKVYTITFKDYDGSIISKQILKPGEDIIAPENPSREGYRFIGWDKDYNNITSDLEINALYKESIIRINLQEYEGTNEFDSDQIINFIFKDYAWIEYVLKSNSDIIKRGSSKNNYLNCNFSLDFSEYEFQTDEPQTYELTYNVYMYSTKTETIYGITNTSYYRRGIPSTNTFTFNVKRIDDKIQQDFKYRLYDKNKIMITGYIGNLSQINIPEKIEGYDVKKIAENAFRGNERIIKVNLPKTISDIENNAFTDCKNLEEINYPINLEKSGYSIFEGCDKLIQINIPEGVTKIPDWTFSYSNLETINMPNTLKYIGSYSFCECKELKNIELPNSIEEIMTLAFGKCSKLENINYPMNLKRTGINIFDGCTELTTIYVPEGVTEIISGIFSDRKIGSVNLPSTLEKIGRLRIWRMHRINGIIYTKWS